MARGSLYRASDIPPQLDHVMGLRSDEVEVVFTAALAPPPQSFAVRHGPAHYARENVAGTWSGSACAIAGVKDDVTMEDALRVFDQGIGADGRSLRTTTVKNVALVEVLTLKKSWSLLAVNSETRAILIEAIAAGREAQLRFYERDARVRRGKDGVVSEPVAGLVQASWTHLTSAVGDPHAHAHTVTLATAPAASDGKLLTLDGIRIYHRSQRVGEAIARYVTRSYLERHLGLAFDEHGELLGMPRELIETFSRAGQRVEEILEAAGLLGDATAAEHATAWRQFRADRPGTSQKVETEMDAELLALSRPERAAAIEAWWRQRAREAGHDLDAALAAAAQPYVARSPATDEEVEAAMLRRLERWPTVASPSDLLAWACEEIGEDVERAETVVRALLTRGGEAGVLHRLAGDLADPHDRWAWTNRSRVVHLATLREDVARARRARRLARPSSANGSITAGLLADGDPEARKALALATSDRPLVVISGVAGAGKNHAVLGPLTAGLAASRRTTWVTSRNALRALETGAELNVPASRAVSLAHLEALAADGRGPQPGDVLIVDEGGLLDRRAADHLLWLAEHGVLVRCVGERAQIQAIDRRGAWQCLVDGAAAGGSFAELKTTYRCAAWQEEFELLRAARPAAISRALLDGRVVAAPPVGEDALLGDRLLEIVHGLAARAGDDAGAPPVVLTQANALAHDLARRLQADRLGRLPNPNEGLEITDGQQALVGDLVRTRLNDPLNGIRNGETWVVEGADELDGLTLRRPAGSARVTVPANYAKHYVELAAVLTGDSSQGITADQAIVVVTGTEGRSWAYSAAARSVCPPIFVVQDAVDEEDAARILCEVLERDDLARPSYEAMGLKLDDAIRIIEVGEVATDPEPGSSDKPGDPLADRVITVALDSPARRPAVGRP